MFEKRVLGYLVTCQVYFATVSGLGIICARLGSAVFLGLRCTALNPRVCVLLLRDFDSSTWNGNVSKDGRDGCSCHSVSS
ncbi:hypothetical protein B0H12DRAFT_165494 [Mycena haematopus]|nr:hypothetical protein B0H12DRAFT_165494 [Mycena haematopus]